MSHLPLHAYKSSGHTNKRVSSAFSVEDVASYLTLPSIDRSEWYYPSHPAADSDSQELSAVSKEGNWGNKTLRAARWIRRGKKVAWGPAREEWEAEEHARKRLKSLLPSSRSPSPPSLLHLRSPSPPLTAPYPVMSHQHICYSSFVLDQSLVHSFRSGLLNDLEHTTASLIEGEAAIRRTLGRLWQVLREDPDERGDPITKAERDDSSNDVIMEEGPYEPALPDLSEPVHKIFLTQFDENRQMMVEPSHFGSPQMQMETLENSIGVLKDLNDNNREYSEVLEEIREGLGGLKAQRDLVWSMVRNSALRELQELETLEDCDKTISQI